MEARMASASRAQLSFENDAKELRDSKELVKKLQSKIVSLEAAVDVASRAKEAQRMEIKTPKLQLADVEDFLSTKRGEHVKMLEMAPATTRLEMARAAAENDMLKAENDMLAMRIPGPV